MSCDIYEMMSHKFNFCDSIAEASIVSSRIYREQIFFRKNWNYYYFQF